MPTDRSGAPRKRIPLTGPSVRLDPATHAVRGDLADVELAERVFAPHYAASLSYRGMTATQILAEPEGAARGPLAVGEGFAVFDLSSDWAWGRSAGGWVGYVPQSAVAPA